jgi:hypothetical protein
METETNYSDEQSPGDDYGSSQNSSSPYRRAPKRVADKDPPAKEPRIVKKEWKARKLGPQQATKSIYILFYLGKISPSYSFDMFLQRLHGSSDPDQWFNTSKFFEMGVDVVPMSDSKTAWSDLGSSLNEPGAVVIYWGHSERAKNSKQARNIRPERDPDKSASDITIGQLKELLKVVNAKAFILASCATDGCIGKIKRDTAIIATDSGKNLVTDARNWSNALESFLKKFLAGATIAECIAEANKSFPNTVDPDDKFVLASGLGTLTSSS